ncbi:MAG: LysM peptidoglycan-binding domain-containing protein [Gammaproteobacteria bacterium]|nr:LysM peptidoglycan-binding domain-containing protein [Gammaproteobacteria bacterium]
MMKITGIQTAAQLLLIAFLGLGLVTGCATTTEPEQTAAEAIAAAKAANAEAKSLGYEWRDTAKIIKSAEAALAAGNEDEARTLANEARLQAENAIAQKKAEDKKFADSMSDADSAALSTAESDMSHSEHAGMGVGVTSYSVVRGDNLWDISGKENVYGNSFQWPLIYKTNRDKIKDADLIYPGQVFDIDQNASASDIDAAINHAKTRGAWSVGDVEQADLDYLAQ